MAKRSDFAQKLLDDLRLRKERMAATQSSNHSTVSIDAYAYAKQNYRGSRHRKPHAVGSTKTRKPPSMSSDNSRQLPVEDSSKQLVLYGRGQRSEQMGDLSMVLGFALENGGKFMKMKSSGNNPILDFLHQMGRRHMDLGMMERTDSMVMHRPSNSHLPTISHHHLREISKGALKLNQILRACSNRVDFDRYSVEIGRELLKGAMDLEESLRMLVSLQEASEYVITPQRKSQITLLEDDDNDNTVKTSEEMQLELPRFSFDKPSKVTHNIQAVAKTDIRNRLIALKYQKEANNFNSTLHNQPALYGPNVKTLAGFPEQKKDLSPPQSKTEKGKIPNVIAKLMGLDELPENVNMKNTKCEETSSKKKMESPTAKKTAHGSTKNAERKAKETEKMIQQNEKSRPMQPQRVPMDLEKAFSLQAEKKQSTHSIIFNMVMHAGKPSCEDLEGSKSLDHSKKATIKEVYGQNYSTSSSQDTGTQKDISERYIKKHWEHNSNDRDTSKTYFLKDDSQWIALPTYKRSEAAFRSQENIGCKENILQAEKKGTNKLLVNQQKPRTELGFQHSYVPQSSQSKEEKHLKQEREQQRAGQKPQMKKQKGSEAASKLQKQQLKMNQVPVRRKIPMEAVKVVQSEKFPKGRKQRDASEGRSSSDLKLNLKGSLKRNPTLRSTLKDPESRLEKVKSEPLPPLEDKHIHSAPTQKAKGTKMHARTYPPNVDEAMGKVTGSAYDSTIVKHLNVITQEVKQTIKDKENSSKAGLAKTTITQEAYVIESNKSVGAIQALNAAQLQKEASEVPALNIPVENKYQSRKEPQIFTLYDNSQNRTTTSNCWRGRPYFSEDEGLVPCKTTLGAHNGDQDRINICYSSQLDSQKVSVSRKQEFLTESENRLKKMLIKSQLFLNTAEALFKLNIPVGILHAGGQDCPDEDSKLVLDCGYEVMKKKGRRQELSIHPCLKISIFPSKVRSLDGLIKQLHKDFEKLKQYGRRRSSDCDASDYLPRMLETDLRNVNPDINCMWDLGWSEITFASLEKDDVIREVEKHVLSGLIDEATRDFLQ